MTKYGSGAGHKEDHDLVEGEVHLAFTEVGTIELKGKVHPKVHPKVQALEVKREAAVFTYPVCRRLYYAMVNVEEGQLTAVLQPVDQQSQDFLQKELEDGK